MLRNDFVSNSSSSSFVCATNMDLKTMKKELLKGSVKCSALDRTSNDADTKTYLKGLAKRNKENLDNYLGKRLLFLGEAKTGKKVQGWKNQLLDETACCYFCDEEINIDNFKDKTEFFDYVKLHCSQNSYTPNGIINKETIRTTLEMKKRGWLNVVDEQALQTIQQKLDNGDYVYVISYGYSGEGEDDDYIYVNDPDEFFDGLALEYLKCDDLQN